MSKRSYVNIVNK